MSVKLAFHQISSMAIALCLGAIPPMQAAEPAPLAQNNSERQVFAEPCDRALEIDTDDATTWTNRGTISSAAISISSATN
ncbi:MAG TPA: hypothetical protein IGS17_02270 [Oscillatoriales cyanobacterium M59_W2019_021]|nr:MAG: hypothetical protein D6728_12895 [Cyanobacteria bacterium J055]HIK31952.1 hypothetical protein [Oscillatoriales cyanobacterium M4454_W2019_049]HIK49741.1 hypothetical protein [Oscillatoriales cyanobacterium M59_W2019_021]